MELKDENEKESVCPICGKIAHLKCSGCRLEFYCNKEHQRQDWSRHKSICQAWEVHENAELGRHLLASRDLNPGDLIVSELPLVWGPVLHMNQRICVGCGKQCKTPNTRCPVCLWPACESHCPGLTDKNRHGLECTMLVKSRIIPRSDVLIVIRMLLLWRTKSKRWSALEKLESHEDVRGLGTDAYGEMTDVAQHLERFLVNTPGGKDVLAKIYGIVDVNALETTPPEGSIAIYETACLLEHCCLPNTRHTFTVDDKGRPRITVKTLCSVKKGEHLSTMYTHALWATRARRAHLLETKYFSCRCKRCGDPTELGTHLGTLKCPQDNGAILPKDPFDFETEWACDSCTGVLSASEVAGFTGKLEEEVDDIMSHARKEALVDLLSRLKTLLHPGHQHCIAVSHSLIQLLPASDPLKAELCKRVIETTTTVDPYGARLALYTAVALRELSTCPGENRRELLFRAVSLLEFEPANSAGEKFRRLIEPELAYL